MKRLLAALLLCALPAPALAADGWASTYGQGNGVAMPFCTWTLRHAQGCGWVQIQSADTGVIVTVKVVDYCACVVPGSAHPYRIVDLEPGVVAALGLDPSRGLWQVSVERVGATLPDTATRQDGR